MPTTLVARETAGWKSGSSPIERFDHRLLVISGPKSTRTARIGTTPTSAAMQDPGQLSEMLRPARPSHDTAALDPSAGFVLRVATLHLREGLDLIPLTLDEG